MLLRKFDRDKSFFFFVLSIFRNKNKTLQRNKTEMETPDQFDRFLMETDAAAIFCEMLEVGSPIPVKVDTMLKASVEELDQTIAALQENRVKNYALWSTVKEKRLKRLQHFQHGLNQNPSRKRLVNSLAAAMRAHVASLELQEHNALMEQHRKKTAELHDKRKQAFEAQYKV